MRGRLPVAAVFVACWLSPGIALAMGATGGEMLGTTTAPTTGHIGGAPAALPPLAPVGTKSLPIGKPPPKTAPPEPVPPPAEAPAPQPCGDAKPPCR